MGLSSLTSEDIEKQLVLTEVLLADILEIIEIGDVFVPYVGATKEVDLGSQDFRTSGNILTSGGGFSTGAGFFTTVAYFFGVSTIDAKFERDGVNVKLTQFSGDGRRLLLSGLTTVPDRDEVQVSIKGHTTQTNDILLIEDSSGTDLLDLDNSGNLTILGTLASATHTISSALVLAAGSITDSSGTISFGDELITAGKGTFAQDGVALDVQNTTDSASNQIAIFRGANRVTPTDNDSSFISITGDDSTGTQVEIARMTTIFRDVTSTSKDARMTFNIMDNNALRNYLLIGDGAFVINEDSQDVDFRVESNNNTAIVFINGGLDQVSFGNTANLSAMVAVNGFADEIQFLVQGHSTQTSNIAVFELSNGTDVVTISTSGMIITGELEINGDLNHDGTNIGFFSTAPTTQQTALTTQDTSITHTAPGTPDFAIQDLVDSGVASAFGFATKDEGNTVLQVILNLQVRVQELEDKLQAYGLLA